MIKTKFAVIVVFLLSTALGSDEGFAQDDEREGFSGWNVGLSYGSASTGARHFEDSITGNCYAGFRSTYLGAEVAYGQFGRFKHDSVSGTGVNVWSVSAAVIPRYPVFRLLELEGILGVHRWNAKARLLGNDYGSDDGTDLTYGFGAWVPFKFGLAVSLRWQQYKEVSGSDLSQLMLGMNYVFH